MSEQRRILIRSSNWLGDAIMSIPAIKLVQQLYPEYKIDVFCNEKIKDLFFYVSSINAIHTFKKKCGIKGVIQRYKDARKLKDYNYSICFIFPNSFDSALIPWMAGIEKRIGFDTNFRSFLLTDKINPPKDYFKKHHSLHYLDIVKKSFNDFKGYENSYIKTSLLEINEDYRNDCIKGFNNIFSSANNKEFVAITPGAEFGGAKKWLPKNYKEICKQCVQKNKIVLLFGTKNDYDDCENIAKDLQNVFNLAGKTSLKQFISLLSLCSLLVTNDSGGMHVGGAIGINVLAIFGSTSPNATKALGPVEVIYNKVDCSPCFKRECDKSDFKCMNGIKVDDVWDKVKVILNFEL